MPMQDRHVLGVCGVRMPTQQMVVVLAGFARGVVMADVVKIRDGQRRVAEREHERKGQEGPPSRSFCAKAWSRHALVVSPKPSQHTDYSRGGSSGQADRPLAQCIAFRLPLASNFPRDAGD
jgi:hypothetical protein